ncbi:C4-dicarboxylate transporter DctQ subunit [Sedimentibacter acidaminivorans]|uniref:C4-dicarboxylate transporter DctQ subunit n=1 Tax=Sedimentibacter acidaminivorans TaxID=913099 RepID=A0ABS4GE01_9FIRM|nr:TRAP transporter small permease [Sedimentibacter acidaminivorans]MBP1925909.1 C4-dicarboxylate transporter DctQ subunit [Sedimentibacter acidaminivorans]
MKKFFDNFENYFMAGGLFIMTFITVINVMSRKFLGLSMSFLEEITTAMFILISLLGAAVAAKRGGHLGLSVLTDLIPKKFQKYVALLTWAAAAFFSFFLIKFGVVMVQSEIKMGMTTAALGWPEWIFGTFLPIGGMFIFVRFTLWTISFFISSKEVK